MNLPNKDVTIDQVLSLLVSYFSNNLDFCKDMGQNKQNNPHVWRIKLYLSNFLFCIKIVFLYQFRHSSVHVIANCNPLTNTRGQKILYKLPLVNRLNYPTHFKGVLARKQPLLCASRGIPGDKVHM